MSRHLQRRTARLVLVLLYVAVPVAIWLTRHALDGAGTFYPPTPAAVAGVVALWILGFVLGVLALLLVCDVAFGGEESDETDH